MSNSKTKLILTLVLGLGCSYYQFTLAFDECAVLLDKPLATYRASDFFQQTMYYLKFQNHSNQLRQMMHRWMQSRNAAVFPSEHEFYARAFAMYSELLDVSVLLFPHKKYPLGSSVTLEDGSHTLKFPQANFSQLAKGFIEEFKIFRDAHSNTQFKNQTELYEAMKNSGNLELHLMGALLFSPEKIIIQQAKAQSEL
jgi:hypothetical protein